MSRFSARATGSQPGNACSRDRWQPTDEFFQKTQDYDKLKERLRQLAQLPGLQAAQRLQFILVHGEAGMGKTSLVTDLCHDSGVLDNVVGYEVYFFEFGAGAGIDSRDAAARQAEARRIELNDDDIRLATRAKSSRKLIVLDGMKPDQANDCIRILDSSASLRLEDKLTVVIITSREDPNAWSHVRTFQYSINIEPEFVARLAMLAKYAYEDSTRCQLDDAHEDVGEDIVRVVRAPHQLCLIGCALYLESIDASWRNILSDQKDTGAANLQDIVVAAPEGPYRSSANLQEIQEALKVHLSVTKQQIPACQKLEWDVLLRVLGLFNWDDPLPLVALQIVWRAYVEHMGGGSCLSGFDVLLQALVNARVLEPFPRDMGMAASLFRLGVGVREHNLLRKLFIFRSIIDVNLDLPKTEDTTPNLVVQAFICRRYYGSDKEAALAALHQLPGVQPLPAKPWLSHFEARKLYEINIPAVLEQLLRAQPQTHWGLLVQQLLVSAATGSVLCYLKLWLHELLQNISTAPLALAVFVGALQEEQGRWVHRIRFRPEHGEAIDQCCQNCLGGQLEPCAAAYYLRQVWKVVFLELGDYNRAHQVIKDVCTLLGSRRGDGLQLLQARRWMAATCVWTGDREKGRVILDHNLILVKKVLKGLCAQQPTNEPCEPAVPQAKLLAEQQQLWRIEHWRTLLAISEMFVGTRSHKEALKLADEALKLADEALRECEQFSGCGTAFTVQARRMKAWSWRHQGKYDEALREFKELLKDRRGMQRDQQRDQEHYLTLLSQAELGVAYGDKAQADGDKQKHSDALTEKEVALEGLRPILGDGHPLCLKLQRSIAVTLVLLGLHDRALKSDKELLDEYISRQMLVDQLQARHDTAVDQYLWSRQLLDPGVPLQAAWQEAVQLAAALEDYKKLAVIECGDMRGECPWQSDMEQDIQMIFDLFHQHSGRQEQQKTSPVMIYAANSHGAANKIVRAFGNAGEGFDVGTQSWTLRKTSLFPSLASSPIARFCLNKRELPLFPLVVEE